MWRYTDVTDRDEMFFVCVCVCVGVCVCDV